MNLKKYLPSKGTDIEVGGIISAKSKKNTVNDRRIEMDKDTWKKVGDIFYNVKLLCII